MSCSSKKLLLGTASCAAFVWISFHSFSHSVSLCTPDSLVLVDALKMYCMLPVCEASQVRMSLVFLTIVSVQTECA